MSSEMPQSFWFAREAPAEELDAVVIGGGLVGLGTAWWAARRGLQVTVLEAERLGAGATGRSNGFLLTGGLQAATRLAGVVGRERALGFWRFSLENRELIRRELVDSGLVACDFRPEGSWRTAAAGSPAEEAWESSAAILGEAGLPVRWEDRAEVRRRTGSPVLGGALFVEGDGGLDPVALCRGLATSSGAAVRVGVHVRRLEPDPGGVRLVWNGGSARARRVVIATNAYAGPLVPTLAAKLRPVGLQGLATAAAERWLDGLWAVDSHGLWLRQLADGTLLAAGGAGGGSREGGYLELPTATGQASLEGALAEVFPAAPRARIDYRWAGTVALTEDGLPWVRTLPEVPGVAYACGFNGQGLSLGFAVGRALADWLADPSAPLDPFSP